MIKEGRKPSNDPAQEKLRQGKNVWNKEVSAFINDLIHAKKLMNGWPSKYYKERSKIISPIPVDVASILNGLASQFQELSQQGTALSQQQAEYAKNRRQKRVDQGNQTLNKLDEKYGPTETGATPAPPAPVADLSKQLAAWEKKYELVAEGSNPFSRFLTRVKTPQIGFGAKAQKRRLRMDMLKAALKSYRALGKMQVHITKSSKQSVVDAYKSMQEAWNEWSVVSRNFNFIVNSMPDQTAIRPEDMKDEPPPGTEHDLPTAAPKPAAKPPEPVKPAEPISEPPPPLKDSEPPKSPEPDDEVKPVTATAQLEVVAQAFVQKWLGKARHQLIPGKSSGLRLQIFELGDRTRKCINSVMDLLEKGFSVEELGPKIYEVSNNINTLRSLMRSLHNTEKPAPKGKGSPSVFDGIF
jgi:hypothetical protein